MTRFNQKFPSSVILWGGTGQAKVVRPIIEHYGGKIVAVFDDNVNISSPFLDVPLFYGKKRFEKWIYLKNSHDLGFCVAIGNPRNVRISLHDWLIKFGLTPVTVCHPNAQIADNAIIRDGCQFMAGAIVGVEAKIGRQCIINTRASVDHECELGDEVELAPGATLCGMVKVGNNSWIGAGATVLPRITIGSNVIIGAGAVVIRNVENGITIVGVPAKRILRKKIV